MRNLAKDYIENRDWHDAIYSYMRVIHQYDIWEKDYPEDDKTEGKGMIYCNMSYCLYMIKCHPDAITAADEACLLVPKYFKVWLLHPAMMCINRLVGPLCLG